MSGKIKELIDKDAFYYISAHNNLMLSHEGTCMYPAVMGGFMAKAFWIKDSPAPVWRFKDIYDTREKFKNFLLEALARGADEDSVRHVARQAAGEEFEKEVFKKECTKFCEGCGDCMDCHAEDACYGNDGGEHWHVDDKE